MELQAGNIIVSTSQNVDDYFGKSIILLVEVNEDGVIGFFLNKSFGRNLNELQEFASQKAIPLFVGGPVDQSHLYIIHSSLELGGDKIGEELYYSGDFKKALTYNAKFQMKIFLGYCGWDLHQLLDEIKEGDWRVLPSSSLDIIFNEDIATIWNQSVDK